MILGKILLSWLVANKGLMLEVSLLNWFGVVEQEFVELVLYLVVLREFGHGVEV